MISRREFSRRDGCDEALVRKAVQSGALPQLPGKRLPAALVGTAWRAGNRLRAEANGDAAGKPASAGETLAEALRQRQIALARLRKRQYDRRAAAWVDRATAAEGWNEIVSEVRARLAQVAPAAAALIGNKPPAAIHAALASVINHALAELSTPPERPCDGPDRRDEPAIGDDWSRLDAERAKVAAITAGHRLTLAIETGRVVHIEATCAEIGNRLSILRSRLIGLPATLAPRLFRSDLATAERVIAEAVGELLDDLPTAEAILRGLQ